MRAMQFRNERNGSKMDRLDLRGEIGNYHNDDFPSDEETTGRPLLEKPLIGQIKTSRSQTLGSKKT